MSHQQQPILISVEGNIGTGKSTLLEYLKIHFNSNITIGYLEEPVNEWNKIKDKTGHTILEKYYTDQTKYGFAFQMMAYISRLSILKAALNERKYDIIITERSLFTDRHVFAQMLYDDKKIEEVEYIIYLKWFDEFMSELPQTYYIYLQSNPAVSFARVNKRGRAGEVIPIGYLENCHHYHNKWLIPYMNRFKKILVLDANGDIADNLSEWLIEIEKFIALHRKPFFREGNTNTASDEHLHIMYNGC
jgi:deoxyadenosine/deoxycytidine kinase